MFTKTYMFRLFGAARVYFQHCIMTRAVAVATTLQKSQTRQLGGGRGKFVLRTESGFSPQLSGAAARTGRKLLQQSATNGQIPQLTKRRGLSEKALSGVFFGSCRSEPGAGWAGVCVVRFLAPVQGSSRLAFLLPFLLFWTPQSCDLSCPRESFCPDLTPKEEYDGKHGRVWSCVSLPVSTVLPICALTAPQPCAIPDDMADSDRTALCESDE
ncbi:hypothetical protein COCON_G00124220 [Conger conger]|uniref:Uncharacterized protein n=1 Tax=Conger conger TaxID=82655 RepID=A0A9Q1HYE9_CONCO|nr:hypothetical protein COCON_G00124220 [Conger conger]